MVNSDHVFVDTDILIDHLKGIDSATSYIHKIVNSKIRPLISIISRIELLSGSKIDEIEEAIIKDLLKLFDVVILDEFLADLSATFRKKYYSGLADSIIAASAYKENATLITRNVRHFKGIRELKVIRPYKL